MAPLHHHFEKSGLEGDAGRRALLDHHHAAVPDRPVQPEAALMKHPTTSTCWCSASANRAWRWRAGAPATARACAWVARCTRAAPMPRWPTLPAALPCAARSGLRRGLAGAPRRWCARAPASRLPPRPASLDSGARACRADGARRRPGAGRARTCSRARWADLKEEPSAAMPPEAARHHRHQRQDHHHRDDRGLVERAGRRVAWPATSARPCCRRWPMALDAAAARKSRRLPEVWVLELSSFQLDGVEGFEPMPPRCSTSPRTILDWHGSMAPTRGQGARVRQRCGDGAQPRRPAGRRCWCRTHPGRKAATRSRSNATCPLWPGDADAPRDFGIRPRTAWLAGACAGGRRDAQEPPRRRGRRDPHPAPDAGRRAAHPRPPQRRQCAGRAGAGHRHRLPAGADAARPARIPAASRIAWSRSAIVGGVDAFDDSKGTNVGATVAALDGLGADKAPASWSSSSAATARGRTSRRWPRRGAACARRGLIGRDAPPHPRGAGRHWRAAAAPRHAGGRRAGAEQAACRRRRAAESPACASLDMFRNYAPRQVFVATVLRRPSAGRSGHARLTFGARHGAAAGGPAPSSSADRQGPRPALPVRDCVTRRVTTGAPTRR